MQTRLAVAINGYDEMMNDAITDVNGDDPLVIPQLIEEMFELMLEKARQIHNPFEQAFFVRIFQMERSMG